MLRHEQAAWADGLTRLAGLDEAGRGPLAGPVIAAAVNVPRDQLERLAGDAWAGLTDSKKLTPARREFFFARITQEAGVAFAVGRAEVAEIDRLNILRATHLAMKRALDALPGGIDCVLVDGLPVPGLPFPSRAFVGGDGQSLLIAAASVVAKVVRDREMTEADAAYPGYGFAEHKGYGTAAHLDALGRLGPSPLHRRSFAPVRQMTLFPP